MIKILKGVSASTVVLLLATPLLTSQSHAHGYAGQSSESDFSTPPGFELPPAIFEQVGLESHFNMPSSWGEWPVSEALPGFIGSHHPYFRGRHHRRGHGGWKDCDTPTNPVPVPPAIVMMSTALVGLAGFARTRKNKVA